MYVSQHRHNASTHPLLSLSLSLSHTHTHTWARSRTTHTHTHTHIHTHTRTYTHTRTHTRTHAHTHARTHAHTHTHKGRTSREIACTDNTRFVKAALALNQCLIIFSNVKTATFLPPAGPYLETVALCMELLASRNKEIYSVKENNAGCS